MSIDMIMNLGKKTEVSKSSAVKRLNFDHHEIVERSRKEEVSSHQLISTKLKVSTKFVENDDEVYFEVEGQSTKFREEEANEENQVENCTL